MPAFDSNEMHTALTVKMKAKVKDSGDRQYKIYDEENKYVARTLMSKGAKHTITASLAGSMSKQLGLNNQQFSKLVDCTLSRSEALEIMKQHPRRG